MIDVIYLIVVLLIGSQLAKLSISGTAYALLLGSVVIFVLVSSFLILNNPDVSAVTSDMARYIEQFGVGDPDTWRHNSKAFREVIDGCYYLTFFSAAIFVFISAIYEGKRMQVHRKNETKKAALIICIIVMAGFLYIGSSTASGPATTRVRSLFSTEFGVLTVEAIILYAAVMAGKQLRAIFNKQI